MEQGTLTAIEKVIFLKSVDIFKHATVEELGGVAALTEEVHFEPGETIYREGEPVDAIYLVLKGRVAVEGNGKAVREVGEKQAFGTVAALDLEPAIHTVKAIDPVYALKLNAQDLQDMLSLDFELVQAVIRALCRLDVALNSFRKMVEDTTGQGEQGRVEAARLAGEVNDPAFSTHLNRLIREDQSYRVVHAAMAAAGKGKYAGVVRDVVFRLGGKLTKAGAREALIEYGEIAVKELRTALFDSRTPRDIRLNIPRTLSKIHSQSAMNALQSGLLEEDGSIRFNSVLALEEMARRFADLKVDREIIESAITSDVMLYCRRFAIFSVLFTNGEDPAVEMGSLLSQALTDSMERVKERVMWLLSLVYPAKDIRRFWAALNSGEPNKRAHAIEFLDNLLSREIKSYVFLLFGDAVQAQRFRASLDVLGMDTIDTESALRALLEQSDIWLTAATVWEIGIRGLTGFRDKIAELLNSDHTVLREAAGKVIHRI